MVRIFSFGGGVQSTAAMVLASQGRINYKAFVFAHVGEDSENPATLRYLKEYAVPFMEHHGLVFYEVHRTRKNGEVDSVLEMTLREAKSIRLPMRMSETGKPGNRSCTVDFKIKPIQQFFKKMGATAKNPAVCGVGISMDEVQRMRSSSGVKWQTLEYPLVDLGLSRSDCQRIIQEAGLPVPPKSSCWFCPFHQLGEWLRLYDEEPELFWKSVDLEKQLNIKRANLGLTPVWMCSKSKPLNEAILEVKREKAKGQTTLYGFEETEKHSCGPFVCSV